MSFFDSDLEQYVGKFYLIKELNMSIDTINSSYTSGWYAQPTKSRSAAETETDKPVTDDSVKPEDDSSADTGLTNPWYGDSSTSGMLDGIIDNIFGTISKDGVNIDNPNGNSYDPPISHAEKLNNIMNYAMETLGLSGQNLTFNELLQHGEELTEIFSAKVKTGLTVAGVSSDAQFNLTLESDGSLKVHTNHPDKAKIEKFFKDNPGLAEDYQMIEGLNELETTRKNNNVDLNSAYSQGRLLSMSTSYTGSNAMAMNSSGHLTSFLSGINTTA